MYTLSLMKQNKDLVAASSVPMILSILLEGEDYGYAILRKVRQLADGKIAWRDGMLFPVLHWLEEHGYVKARWSKSEAEPRRKYYRLNSRGIRYLEQQHTQCLTVNNALPQFWRECHV